MLFKYYMKMLTCGTCVNMHMFDTPFCFHFWHIYHCAKLRLLSVTPFSVLVPQADVVLQCKLDPIDNLRQLRNHSQHCDADEVLWAVSTKKHTEKDKKSPKYIMNQRLGSLRFFVTLSLNISGTSRLHKDCLSFKAVHINLNWSETECESERHFPFLSKIKYFWIPVRWMSGSALVRCSQCWGLHSRPSALWQQSALQGPSTGTSGLHDDLLVTNTISWPTGTNLRFMTYLAAEGSFSPLSHMSGSKSKLFLNNFLSHLLSSCFRAVACTGTTLSHCVPSVTHMHKQVDKAGNKQSVLCIYVLFLHPND